MVNTTVLGVVLGAVFVLAIGVLFLWMFRVPPALSLPAAKACRSLTAVRKILVPITESIPSERAVGLACRLGREQGAELVLVNVIVVPFSLSLNSAIPVDEKKARDALELGATIAQRDGCTAHQRIIRHRSVPDGILQVAREEEVDAIVLGVGLRMRAAGQWGRTSLEVLRRASCEVILDKVCMEEQPAAATPPPPQPQTRTNRTKT